MVAELSDWEQVVTLFRTSRDCTSDFGEARVRTSVLEFASIAASDRCMKDLDPCREEVDMVDVKNGSEQNHVDCKAHCGVRIGVRQDS